MTLLSVLSQYLDLPSVHLLVLTALRPGPRLLRSREADQRKARPVKLTDIRSETSTTLVSFASGDLKVTYRPNTFTADVADEINAAIKDPTKQTDAMFQMVGANLVDWDLEDDAGKVIPLDDPKRLRAEVPMAVFGRIFQQIQADQDPGKAGKTS